ncbi:MAG: helicase associated domain-containing protein [Gallionellaceae bacterium]|nr:helicase associated domain-containing protein [Gallionellaceae bacterium]
MEFYRPARSGGVFQRPARFAELVEYINEYGDSYVPQGRVSGLGLWVANQRQNYKKGNISSENISRLNDIGFSWTVHESVWDGRFDELLKYREKYGNVDVPANWPAGLGSWVATQRGKKRRGDLTNEQVQKLDEVGVNWNPIDSKWQEMFDTLREFYNSNGHTNLPQRPTNPLGTWVRHQRDSKKIGRLPIEQVLKLEEIGFQWDVLDANWDAMFKKLVDFKSIHGHTNVPTSWPTYLGTWVSLQRKANKSSGRGTLSLDRKKRLDEIGFIWDAFEFEWEESYKELVRFKTSNGHVNVPSSHPSGLGTWASHQRVLKKKDKLSIERIRRLEDIGFVWDSFSNKWEIGFRYLRDFAISEGHCKVPQKYMAPDGYRVGQWLRAQRSSWDTLSSERKERLRTLPSWSDPQ